MLPSIHINTNGTKLTFDNWQMDNSNPVVVSQNKSAFIADFLPLTSRWSFVVCPVWIAVNEITTLMISMYIAVIKICLYLKVLLLKSRHCKIMGSNSKKTLE